MKILLLGGTGAIGSDLANILSDDNNEVFVTTRRKRKNKDRITYITGNALNDNFIKEVLKESFDIIVDFMMYNNLNLFKNRIEILLEKTGNYIFTSSSRVYADSVDEITEDSPRLLETVNDKKYLKSNDYAILKCKEEDILKNTKKKNYTIIRPYITYNYQKLQLGIYEKEKWLFRALDGRTVVFSKDLLDKETTLSYGYDVAKQIANICYRDSGRGEIYQITTTKAVYWKDILEIYANTFKKVLGREMKIKLVDNIYETKIVKPDYQYEYDRIFDRKFNSNKLYNLTGIFKEDDVRDSLEKCLTNFLKNPEFLKINWRDEAVKDKICKEKANMKNIKRMKDKIIYIIYRYSWGYIIENFARRIKRLINYIRY